MGNLKSQHKRYLRHSHTPSLVHSSSIYSALKRGSQIQFQHVCGGFPKTTSNSWTPPGRLRIQLNSDTIYLKIESHSTGKGLSPTRPTSTSDTSCKSRLLPVLLTNWLQTGSSNNSFQLRMPITSPCCYPYF